MTIQSLEAARPALLALQATLLQVERRERERMLGRIPPGAWYAAILEDPSLAWLRPLGQLVSDLDAAMDEAVKSETPLTPQAVDAFVARARACLVPGPRYLELLQDYPDVVIAHRDAVRALPPVRHRGELHP
jgi:hypothetical protein